MRVKNYKNFILFIKKSLLYIFPIVFIITVSSYPLFDKFSKKFSYNLLIELEGSFEKDINILKLKQKFYGLMDYAPVSDGIEISVYFKKYIVDLQEILNQKTNCVIRTSTTTGITEDDYTFICLSTNIEKKKIEEIIKFETEKLNKSFINMYNNYMYQFINNLDLPKINPKQFYINNFAKYTLNTFEKKFYKELLLTAFFVSTSVTFSIYFICLLLLNVRLD